MSVDETKVGDVSVAVASVSSMGGKSNSSRAVGKDVAVVGVYVGKSAGVAVVTIGGKGGGCFDSVTVGGKDEGKTDEVSVVVKVASELTTKQTISVGSD